ncbi:LsmAD domain-containing protein [Blakeslea trispora]|nr:LsmAD domain-containing protein [Blakeslea trispora]
MHDRMLFLLASLTGTVVEATVKDGSKFKGILHGASTEGDLGIALKLAQKVHDPSTSIETDKTNPNPIKNTLLIFSKDLMEINAVNVDFNLADTAHADHYRNTFRTDTDISGKLDIRERELHKWAPSTEDEANALGLLEESTSEGAWDQFAANEKLFGLKTDFDEEIYTTPLNRSAPGYKDREKRAIKMANEIQKSTTDNVHMLEERGFTMDEMDEEDLYGAVVRDTNKYVPPALRKQQQSKKETPINKLIDKPITTSLPTARTEKSNEVPPKRIEAEIANTFKHFAMMEKDKLHAKKQALQKKEKDGRLAELKAFHQSFKLNVPIPADLVPLLSKGKKSTETEPERKKSLTKPSPPTSPASDTPIDTKVIQPVDRRASADHTSSEASHTTTATTTTTTSSFKFNVKASSFKPNPTAAAFVPSSVNQTPQEEQTKKVIGPTEHLTITEAFTPSFLSKSDKASSVGPIWPFGHKSYRVQFSQFVTYEDDIFTGYPSPNYTYGYPQYRYPQYVPGMPQMTAVQQGPYISPQFVQNVPISAPMPPSGAPPSVGYSPQMTNVSPHGSPFPQSFPSPQRSPMVPQAMPPQMYQYQGGPMMMRYPPDMIQANGAPHVMMQRPVMVESMQYSPHLQHESPGTDSGTDTPPSTSN